VFWTSFPFIVDRPVPADFVCFRGLLTQLLATPYEGPRSDAWEIAATRYKGTIYLNLRKTEEEVQKIKTRTDEHEKFTRWGYKFEQYLFASEFLLSFLKIRTWSFEVIKKERVKEFALVDDLQCQIPMHEESTCKLLQIVSFMWIVSIVLSLIHTRALMTYNEDLVFPHLFSCFRVRRMSYFDW
jgi:hypothetical protein